MANQSSGKGNPAHKRMSNAQRKNRRAASWARGEKRKEARRQAQKARERVNAATRASGELTPWELAKATRAVGRQFRALREAT